MALGEARVASDAPRLSPPRLTRRASLNSVAAALDYGARTLVELLVTPLLVATLGTYLYGAWRVLWQWTGYLWATSGRSSQALQSAVAHHQSHQDVELKRQYVGSAVLVWLLFLPLLAAVGGVGVWLAPSFLDAPPEHEVAVRAASAVLLVDAMAVTLLTIPRSVLQGENLGYKRMGLSALVVLAGGGFMALAAVTGAGLPGVALAALATTVLTAVTFLVVVRRTVGWFGTAWPERATLRWFLGLSSWFLGWKLVFELMTASDVLLLAGLASAQLVTVYVLTRFVADALNAMALAIVQGVTPGIGGIIGAGDLARAARIRGEVLALTWLLTTVVGVTSVAWNESFVGLWVGPEHYAGALPALLIVLMVVQFVVIRSDNYVIDVTLRVKVKVLLGALATAVSIAAAVVLVGPLGLGITGLCLGMIGGRAILSLVSPWLVGRALEIPVAHQVRAALRPLIVAAVLYAAAFSLADEVYTQSWPVLVAGSAATAGGVLVLAAAAGLTSEQRGRLRRRTARFPSRWS